MFVFWKKNKTIKEKAGDLDARAYREPRVLLRTQMDRDTDR